MKPPRRARLTAATVITNTAMLWLGMAIAAVALWPIYESVALVVLVAVTVLVGSLIAIAGAVYRWPAAVVLPVTIAAFFAFGVPLAVPQEAIDGLLPTIDGLRQLTASVALGWKQLLTVTLPVGAYQGLLVPAFVLVLGITVVSLSTALRARSGGLAALGPPVLLIVALAFGRDLAFWPLWLSLGLFTVTLLWLMWRRWYARRGAIRVLVAAAVSSDGSNAVVPSEHRIVGFRTIAAASVILVTAGAAGVGAVGFAPPEGAREVLRTGVTKPFEPRAYPSPLAGFRQYVQADAADEVLFTVAGLPRGGRIRIATLDTYDGVVYSVGSAAVSTASGSFTRVPSRVDQSLLPGDAVSLDVSVGAYTGVWLPTVGQLERVDFDGGRANSLRDAFFYNDTTGTAAVLGGMQPGDSYHLEAVLPREPSASSLAALSPGAAVVPAIGGFPEETSAVLDRYVDGVAGPGNRLLAMIDGLRAEGYISHGVLPDEPPSRSGHAADRITELVTDQRMIGDAEQYAVTGALMARQLGFPARVVFGFAPQAAAGTAVQVTGSSVSAWMEVDTEQFGWVSLDPTPLPRDIPEEQPEETDAVSRPQSIIPPPVIEPDRSEAPTAPESTQEDPEPSSPWLAIALAVLQAIAWTGLGLAVALSPFLAIIAAKVARRRRRRRAATPLDRISGGWQEYRDAVVDHGLAPRTATTRRELAATVGGTQPAMLAALTDRAVFAPRQPTAEDADKVWRAVTELSGQLDARATKWQRLKARVSTRSLAKLRGRGRTVRRSHRQGATP